MSEITVKDLKERLNSLPDEAIICTGEEEPYISVGRVTLKKSFYLTTDGDELEDQIVVMRND